MYSLLGRAVIKLRWLIVAGVLAVFAIGSTWGFGVFGEFADGGFVSPEAEAIRDAQTIEDRFGSVGADIVVLYESERLTVDDPAFATAVTEALAEIDAMPEVASVVSYFGTDLPVFVSHDRTATYAAVTLTADDEQAVFDQYEAIADDLRAAGASDDITASLGGGAAIFNDINHQVESDLLLAEMISLPILLLIMVAVFGALVAASMPLLVGGLAIVGGFAVTRVIAQFTDVSIFAANVITIIGLGMSIDYSLFVLRRFREELAAGRDKRTAVLSTVATAGRTVMVSGLIIVFSMAGLLFVDVPFLHGIAYGVMSAVGVAMIAALVALPAVLYLLGHRVDKGRLPRLRRSRAADASGAPGSADGVTSATGFWHTVGAAVMRRPVLTLLPVLGGMILLAVPLLGAQFGGVDERAMPPGAESRVVTETLAAEFPGGDEQTLEIMVDGGGEAALAEAMREAAGLDHVAAVRPLGATGEAGLFAVAYDVDPFSGEARGLVHDLRALDVDGAELLVTGGPAELVDSFRAIMDGMPLMVGYIVLVTMIILFFAFGSIVLPIKAVVMNLVSLGAAVGVIVWIFQEGHLSGLLAFEATGYLDPTNLILIVVLMFALSTDYEVFLLSRVREEWDNGADNRTAVLRGMQRTGSIITAAAAILIVVVGAFAFSGIVFMKMIGLGMAIAIFLDATVVRMLLVPSTMRLLGRVNWWVPGPLGRLYSKYGIKEGEAAPDPVPPRPDRVGVTT